MAKADKASTEEFQGVFDETGEGFTFDLSNTEAESGFPVLAKGTYDAIIDKAEYVISKNSGNPMWKVAVLITGPDAEVAAKNVKVFNYVVFKPDQMGRVKDFLEKIGKTDLATADFNPKKVADDGLLTGATCQVRLDIRKSDEYGDGNEIKRFLKAGGAGTGEGGFKM